jgi:hypothetical protein
MHTTRKTKSSLHPSDLKTIVSRLKVEEIQDSKVLMTEILVSKETNRITVDIKINTTLTIVLLSTNVIMIKTTSTKGTIMTRSSNKIRWTVFINQIDKNFSAL